MKAHPPTPTAYSHPPDAWLHMQCNCILVSRTAKDFIKIHLFTIIHLENPLSIPFQSYAQTFFKKLLNRAFAKALSRKFPVGRAPKEESWSLYGPLSNLLTSAGTREK